MVTEDKVYVTFNPWELKNISETDYLENLSTITDVLCEDILEEGYPQIYATCGWGPFSTLKIIRYGLPVA